MSGQGMRESQLAMAQYLRRPGIAPAPAGVEQRRLDIYRRLVYNNIEGFISGGFPVLRSLYNDDNWHELVRAFIDGHRCQTPYFLEIGQEFLQFLLEERQQRDVDPPFMAELAHYEWVELALDVAEEEAPEALPTGDVLAAVPRLSPLAWLLCYQYPVHRIGPDFRPSGPGAPTYLVVYRDREERVRFMELNPVTARLVELTRDNTALSAEALLRRLAGETGAAAGPLLEYGTALLSDLASRSVLGLGSVVPVGDSAVAPPVL